MAPPTPSRRRLLVGVAALLAGCTASDAPSTRADQTTRSPTASPTAASTGSPTSPTMGNYRQVELAAWAVEPTAIASELAHPLSSFDGVARTVVTDAVEDGERTYTTYVERPVRGDVYVVDADEETYSHLEEAVAAERRLTGQQFSMDALSGCNHEGRLDETLEAARESVVDFDDLPAADRASVTLVVGDHLGSDDCFAAGWTYVYPNASAREESVLLSSDRVYLRYEDEYYLVEHRGTGQVRERDYRYTATRVADSKAAFVDVVTREAVVDFDANPPPENERAVLETVLDRGRVEWTNPVPAAVDALVQRLRDRDDRRPRYVLYDGQYYEVRVTEAVA